MSYAYGRGCPSSERVRHVNNGPLRRDEWMDEYNNIMVAFDGLFNSPADARNMLYLPYQ